MATVTRENIGLLNDKITVKVGTPDYLPSFEKALKTYSKNANIPGFRKGMVPAGMIKKMHGPAVFTEEVLRTVEKELNNYMTNEKLEIFAQPLPLSENDARQIDMNKPDEYAFAFEVGLKPEFELPALATEPMTRYKVTVTDEMINEEVDRLRLRHGKMTEPETVSGDDNVLNLTFTEIDASGNETEGGIRKDNSLLVKYFSESFRPGLMGKKKDDSFDLKLSEAFEPKEREWVISDLGLDKEDAAAADKRFRAVVTKVGMVEKADLNEDFYKTALPGKEIASEDAFRDAVKKDIEQYWETQSRNHLQHEIYHVLLDHTNISFPESFLKRWLQTNEEKQKTAEEVETEFPGFVNQLKWTLIIDKIVRDNNIQVLPEDLKAFAKQQLFGYMGMGAGDEEQPWLTDYVNKMMQDKKFVEDSFHRIQTEKVFTWADQQVNAVEQEVSAEDFAKETAKHQHHQH
ncbi:MAG: trigger factor [Chitinophagaceae bacterium]|nr:MAG: trigger factor [Chitinophagaceae bacterium]